MIGQFVRIYQRGRIWYANYQVDRKQHRVSLKTSSMKQARLKALKIDADISRGTWKAAATSTVTETIAAYSDYLRAEERAPKTLAKYFKVFERGAELVERRHGSSISDINLRFTDAYRRQRAENGVGAKTLYNESTIIRQLVNFALSRDMLATDPLKGLKLKKPKPTPQPCWTHEQVLTILAASPEFLRPTFTLLAESGMRFGELSWLTWEDVDFAANVLRVQAKPGWKPKSGDQRAIPLSQAMRDALKGLPRRFSWVVTMPPSRTYSKPDRQWTERRLLSALKAVLKKLKLPGKLHTFRHAFVSNALLNGIPVAVVREWVGHVDDEVIKVYTHVHDSASQSAMQRLEDANQRVTSATKIKQKDGKGSAQIQHTDKEVDSGSAANS
jgi:site-specific recombinase XerD